MIAVLVLEVLIGSGWCIAVTWRRLDRLKAGAAWWWACGCGTLIGAVAGGLFSTCCLYPVSEDVRLLGFPIPYVAFERRGQGWADFVAPGPVMLVVLGLDVLASAGLAWLPVLVGLVVSERRGRFREDQADCGDATPTMSR